MKRIFLIAGARPNFMKVAPIMRELARHKEKFEAKLVHTGQHYDNGMSDVLVKSFDIPMSDHSLQSKGKTHRFRTVRTAISERRSTRRTIDIRGGSTSIWIFPSQRTAPHLYAGSL